MTFVLLDCSTCTPFLFLSDGKINNIHVHDVAFDIFIEFLHPMIFPLVDRLKQYNVS